MEKPDFKLKLRDVPHQPGVYLMKDRVGSVIYIGKARDLRKRVSNYFMASQKMRAETKTRALIAAIWDFEFYTVKNEPEALILENKLIKEYMPRYNIALRDDKSFYLVKINVHDALPKLTMTRLKKDDRAKYLGPFVHSNALRATIEWLNRKFNLRTCSAHLPNENDYKHCHADIIRNCSAPCIGRISQQDYQAQIQEASRLLEGKGRRDLLDELRIDMEIAAQEMNFEKAAMIRDIIQNMELTVNPTRQFSRGRSGLPSTVNVTGDLQELADELGLSYPPQIMECFDISNISSTHIVASMVRFVDGKADNQSYRRYRITTVKGQDDFASMAEVVRRRYSKMLKRTLISNKVKKT
jgi:excinuclease ABC subunit C